MKSFITNHGLVLLRILGRRDASAASIAKAVKITDQAAHVIVQDLVKEGFITKRKVGRTNRYRIKWESAFNNEPINGLTIRDIVTSLTALAGIMTASKPKVLVHLAEHGACTAEEIARGTELTAEQTRSALQELCKDRKVVCRRRRRSNTYTIDASLLPQADRSLSGAEEFALAMTVAPPMPDPIDTLKRFLGDGAGPSAG